MKLSSYFSWVVLILVLLVALGGYLWTRSSKPVPVPHLEPSLVEYGEVPDFELPAHTGETLSRQDLKDKVWVLYSFFASCTTICPVMNKNMKLVQEAYKDESDFKIVGITVNPKEDTVERLNTFAEMFDAIAGKWYYLTGDKKEIYTLLREGFKLGTEEVPPLEQGGPDDFIHSEKFVLVNRAGKICGYYSGTEPNEVRKLIDDARKLIAEK